MPTIKALDHANIITDDLTASVAFYQDVLGLEVRDGPPPLPPRWVKWLYDNAGRPIIHLVSADMNQPIERDTSGMFTGSLHHIAFDCTGYDEMCDKLDDLRVEYAYNELPAIGLSQLFIEDPNGVLLELNFRNVGALL